MDGIDRETLIVLVVAIIIFFGVVCLVVSGTIQEVDDHENP